MQTKYNTLISLIASLVATAFITGCDDDDTVPPPGNKTISETVIADADFSFLEEAVVKANLVSTLNGTGPFTVFAPDNVGFSNSGISSATIAALSQVQAQSIILYHAVPSNIPSSSVPAGPIAKVITASNDSIFVTRNSNGVFVNGIKVTQADISASNGVIHKIQQVLLPPKGNTVETAQQSQGLLDSLVKAVVRATNGPGGDPNLLSTLSTARLTVFAPSNQAFSALLSALSTNDINNIPMPTLLAVLRYHVVAGRAFSSDLTNGNLTMLAGGNTTVNLTNGTGGGPTITGNGNGGNKSNITTTNIITRNGVVHIIDRILLP